MVRFWKAKCALLFVAITLLNYWPVFLGRIPLSVDTAFRFLPFQFADWTRLKTNHAEMSDTVTQFYPWRVLAGRSLRHGVIPLWNPKQLSGSPAAANDQTAIYYPPNWSFAILPGPAAWAFTIILKIGLCGFFTALFVNSIGGTVWAAIASGLIFAFGGYMTAWQGFPHTDSAIWIPLGCYGIQRLRQEASSRYVALTAFALAMTVMGGHPGIATHAVLFISLFAFWQWVSVRGERSKFALLYIIASVLGLGIAAVQIFPTLEWLRQIDRSIEASWGPLDTVKALALFCRDVHLSPNSIGVDIPVGAVYAGAVTLLLIAASIFHAGKRNVGFFVAITLAFAAIAYGIQPLSSASLTVPFYKALKKDEALVLVDFGLAVLAGLGFSVIESWRSKKTFDYRRFALMTAVGIGGLTAWVGGLFVKHLTMDHLAWFRSVGAFWVFLTLGAIAVVVRLYTAIDSHVWARVACLLIALDMISFSTGYTPSYPASLIFPPAPVFDSLRTDSDVFRVAGLDLSTGINWEQMYGLSSAGGYDFHLERLVQLTKDLTLDEADKVVFQSAKVAFSKHRVLDLLNVKYLIGNSGEPGTALLTSNPARFRKLTTIGGMDVFENLKVLPRAFLVPDSGAEILPAEKGQLDRVKDPMFDPLRNVVLPQRLPALHSFSSGNDRVATKMLRLDEGTNQVRLQVTVSEPSVLVLSQMYYPGWKVIIDGRPAPFLRTNFAFTGTHLESGTHSVQFVYKPWSFLAGGILSLASLLLILALAVKPLATGKPMLVAVATVALSMIIIAGIVTKSADAKGSGILGQLILDKTEVIAGRDYYIVTIPGMSVSTATIQYSFNGQPPEEFVIPVDSVGQARLDVSATTKKGTYRFLAFRPFGSSTWISTDAVITVR